MLQGADDAEAVEEASETSLVTRRIWGPVCAEHTNSIGAAAAVASVLLRPSQLCSSESGEANGSAGSSGAAAEIRGH